jgi:nucleotide-binding universal stress UspA family protein
MYTRILVTLENSASDETILAHIQRLARQLQASVVLIHVADGWSARYGEALEMRESEEMREDRAYLERRRAELAAGGIQAEAVLAGGNPAKEIVEAARRERADLIAMATHGHGFVNDLLRGSVANEVRHHTMIPVLLVRDSRAETVPDTPQGQGD